MKYKDYVRLSKISLKSRKKTTRSTVRGISFGLILLMPLLFIVMAFHMDLNSEVNKDASIRVFNIEFVNTTTEQSYVNSMLESNSNEAFSIDGIENIIKYNQYAFNNRKQSWDSVHQSDIDESRFTVIINGETFTLNNNLKITTDEGNTYDGKVGIQIIDTSVGNSIFLKSDSEAIDGKNPLVAGSVFSENNSSKEVIVSSNFLSHYNLTEDIVGKTITLNYEMYYQYSNSASTSKTSISGNFDQYNGMPVTIFKEYKIVGIYDSNIYKSQNRTDMAQSRYGENSYAYDTYFWLTTDSVYNTMNHSYLPEPIAIENDNSYWDTPYYYSTNPIDLAQSASLNGCVFIPSGMGATSPKEDLYNPVYNALLEFKSYSDANKAVSTIENLYKESSTSSDDITVSSYYMQDVFRNYHMFYNVFTYASIVLAIFGGIVFFATLLNLYNTIHYSVQSRRNYLGLTRAIGMKSKEVTTLYFVEVFQIFKRSYIWTAIFGGGICAGVCFLFKMIMESDAAAIITIDLSLNPIYILVAFLLLAVLNTIISIVFSLIACHNVSNKPILEVLVENR